MVVAANHSATAVAVHKRNHPLTQHLCQDLHQTDFGTWPDHDIMMASPACTGFTNARGVDRIHHDACRATAWAVIACVEAKQQKYIVIENVEEFKDWTLYPLWRSCLERLGYNLTESIIDAADLGVPQHRKRLFIVGTRKDLGRPVVVPTPKVAHTPASAVLDWSSGSWSPLHKPGRAQATLDRVRTGCETFGSRFLAPFYGSGSGKTGRSLDRPIGTLTTRDRWMLVDGDRVRMLTDVEALKLTGFRPDYQMTSSRKDNIFLIGNSVSPPVMKFICQTIQHHHYN